jgi:hypothetical protein
LILRVRGFFQLDGYSFRLMFGLSGFLYLSGLIQLILLQAEHRVADLQNFIIRLEIRGRSQWVKIRLSIFFILNAWAVSLVVIIRWIN